MYKPSSCGGGNSNIFEFPQAQMSRHLVPCATLEYSSGFLFVYAAPLFEEEGDVGRETLIADVGRPFGFHRSCFRAGFAADDDPVDTIEVNVGDRAEERLEGDEFNGGISFPQVIYAESTVGVFNSHAHPDVLGPWQSRTDF